MDSAIRSVVVGAGISGLAAARGLSLAGHRVDVVEAGSRLGGKILTTTFAGRAVDEGADAFLTRLPQALDLCRQLGLVEGLVAPATTEASLWSGGRLRSLPAGLYLGVPVDLAAVARSRILSPAGLARAALEPWLPGRPLTGDTAVGGLIRRRYGREVHERLVDPLVGSINAAATDDLSVEVAAPALAAAARAGGSLTRRLRAQPPAPGPPARGFAAPAGGMGDLVDALAKALAERGVEVSLSTPVTGIERVGGAYQVHLAGGLVLPADRVLLAVPAHVAGPLLGDLSPAAAAHLAAIGYSSVAVVTLAYPPGALPSAASGSGFVVARRERRLVTACSIFSNKWPTPAGGPGIVRASVGRCGDERGLALDDDSLVERVDAEVSAALGVGPAPTAARVSRWPRSLPQFAPGHLDRISEAEVALATDAPGVAVAGSYLRGVGIPSCIASGEAAVARLAP